MNPKITVITPSYNQGQYIEATIKSVLDQGYDNLEYIIIDGGSTDESVDVIRRYESHLAYWCSEPDSGQTNAINKGLQRATGDIIAYLNSDDQFLPGALEVVSAFMRHSSAKWMSGACQITSPDGTLIRLWEPEKAPMSRVVAILYPWGLPQPACFWRRELFATYGCFREDLHYAFDTHFQLTLILAGEAPLLTSLPLANALVHPQSKTGTSGGRGVFWNEYRRYMRDFETQLDPKERAYGRVVLWLTDVGSPQPTDQPRPALHEFLTMLRYYPTVFAKTSLATFARVTGLRKWKYKN